MATRAVPLLALLALLMSGCSGGGGGGSDDGSATASSPTPTDGAGGAGAVPERLGPAVAVSLHFTEEGGLAPLPPAAGSLNVGTPAAGFVTGVDPLTFETEPMPTAVLVDPVDILATLYLQGDAPLVSNGAFDIAVWFGSSLGSALFTFATHDPVVAPGATLEMQLSLAFEERAGILVPAGERLVALVTGGFTREQGTIHLLVGGDTPSGLNLTVRGYLQDPLEGLVEAPLADFSGTLVQGANPASCDVAPGFTSLTFPLEVPANASLLRIALEPDNPPAPAVDLDMVLRDGSRVVAATATPFGSEGIFLAAETLEGLPGKTLDLTVYACGNAVIPFRVEAFQASE